MKYNFAAYIKDKLIFICVILFACASIFFMLKVSGLSIQACLLACAICIAFSALCLGIDFLRKRSFYQDMIPIANDLQKSYYATDLLNEPSFLEGEIAYDAIEMIARQAGSEITEAQTEFSAYREYIELWIHEVKTPISAAKLTIARLNGDEADTLSRDIERIESQVEQALFYARMSNLESDYSLRAIPLKQIVRDSIKQYRNMLISAKINIDIHIEDDEQVITDEMWLRFIISQILGNSLKYGASAIDIGTSLVDAGTPREHTTLSIQDNGWGIPEKDMPRIFERAFTGTNGRTQGNATGMGLYLIANMCERMNMSVSVESEEGAGTKVVLSFPHDMRQTDRISLTSL